MNVASVPAAPAGVERPFVPQRKPNRRRTVAEDERAMVARIRNLEAGRATQRVRARERRHAKVRAILSSPLAETCSCRGMRPEISDSELRELGCGCTAPRFVCPILDLVRRAVS